MDKEKSRPNLGLWDRVPFGLSLAAFEGVITEKPVWQSVEVVSQLCTLSPHFANLRENYIRA
jgi:hypothetical protein